VNICVAEATSLFDHK